MNFIIILVTSILLFVLFRVIGLWICSLVLKLLKLHCSNTKFSLSLSIVFFLLYLYVLNEAVEFVFVMRKTEITNLEWYLVYTFMGISAMIWCYFSWSFEWKAKPRFAKNNSQMIIKKIIVFFMVMVFVFYQGYTQLDTNFGGNLDEEKEMLVKLTNITIIPGIIALDRVLNQINNYMKKEEEK